VDVHSAAVDLADCGQRERLVGWITQAGMEVVLLINNVGTGVQVSALCPADQVGAAGFFGRVTKWYP
jgi:short-subunit dehydrogenase